MSRKLVLFIVLLLGITWPASPARAAGETIYQSGDFEYTLLEDGTAEIRRYSGEVIALTIPDALDGHTVSSVGDFAVSGCMSCVSLTIPEGVRNIGAFAFAACDSLVSLDIREGVRRIGNQAFLDCVSLSGLSIPNSVQRIEGLAFSGCDSLRGVMIGSGVESIGINPFAGCGELTQINITSGHPALAQRGGVLYLKADKALVSYPGGLAAETFDIPLGIERIGACAFLECKYLTGIQIPPSVTSIGASAFTGCESLKGLVIPKGVTEIGDSAFYGCFKLLLTLTRDSYAHEYAAANSIPYEFAGSSGQPDEPQGREEELPVFRHVADQAGLLTQEEAEGLEEVMAKLYEDYSFDCLIVTTSDSQGMSAHDYDIMFYELFRDSHEDYPDAAVFSIHTDLNEYYELTKGLGKTALVSQGDEALRALVVPYLNAGTFGEGMFAYLAFVRDSLAAVLAGE